MDRFDGGFESVSSSGPELDTDSNPPPKQPVYTAEMEFESGKIQISIFFKKYQDLDFENIKISPIILDSWLISERLKNPECSA